MLKDVVVRVRPGVPPVLKGAANRTTRAYGVATARWRSLPDFLVLGTKRGGSTSMWNYLAAHPNVLPMFPTVRQLKSCAYFFENYGRGEDWYRSHFHTRAYRRSRARRLGGPVVTGEASPYYLYDPRIPQRVVDLVPQVKAIALLRDPVKRAYSHYWERVGQGVEPLSFTDALAAEPERLAGERERMAVDPLYYSRAHDWYSYRDRGIYLPQVRAWSAVLPATQLLLVRSEDLYRDEQSVLDRAADFLGIPRRSLPSFRQHNRQSVPPMDDAVREELTEFYRPHNQHLAEFLGWDPGWD